MDTTLDWVIGIGQLVAVGGAIAAAVFASRNARAAQRQVEVQTRPLLKEVPQRRLQVTEEVVLPTDHDSSATLDGQLFHNPDEGWLSVPLENVGRGTAVVEEGIALEVSGDRLDLATDIWNGHVPPGEQTRLGLTDRRRPDGGSASPLTEPLARGERLTLRASYTDLAGEQRQQIQATLGTRPSGPALRILDVQRPE